MRSDYFTILMSCIIIAIIIIIAAAILIPLCTQDEVVLTVTDKESYTTTSCSSDSDGYTHCSTNLHMLVYTNGEILQFDDCIVLLIFDAQTQYSHIKPGTYKFKVYGYSVPWLKMYRYVISYR